ncbi:MAG TPA: DUF1972 domain-containing protein [Thermoanaerobaculia bacterium]
MRLAILGTRGIPARYGGFETLAEELSARLAARGHEVTVYTRPRYAEKGLEQWRGAKIRTLPTLSTKHLETAVHGFFSAVHAAAKSYDAILVCNAANALASMLPRATGTRIVLNVDGIEWQRAKWGSLGRMAFRASEILATAIPHVVVADARVIQHYYRERYGLQTAFIPYGGDLPAPKGNDTLAKLGLAPGGYALYVSRLEPENNALAVVEAYKSVPGDLPLVMVGDAPYAREYIARVKSAADSRAIFPGAIYGEGYRQLLAGCRVYIQATEVGGTHPALVEALGYGRVVCYNATPENEEVAGGAGIPFDAHRPESLAVVLRRLLDEPASGSVWMERAKARVQEQYLWNDVTDRYEAVLEGKPLLP